MYNLKSPAEKIQMLFYKALQPMVGRDFKPADVDVTVQPLPNIMREALENERIDAAMDKAQKREQEYRDALQHARIRIDLSRTNLVPHIRCVTIPLSNGCGTMRSDENGVFTLMADPKKLEQMTPEKIIADIVLSLAGRSGSGHLADMFRVSVKGR